MLGILQKWLSYTYKVKESLVQRQLYNNLRLVKGYALEWTQRTGKLRVHCLSKQGLIQVAI